MAPFLQTRRRRLAWILLALPALLLRALIPPGFMPVAAEQGFALEFCPGAAALPPGVAPASAHAHHHHGHGGHAPCLFAASALLGPAPAAAAALPIEIADRAIDERDRGAQLNLPSIVRAQSPRAPPRLV